MEPNTKMLKHPESRLGSKPDTKSAGEISFHARLQAFAKNVWIVDGPDVRDMGIMFTTRMTVAKLSDGSISGGIPCTRIVQFVKIHLRIGPNSIYCCRYAQTYLAVRIMAHLVSRSAIMDVTSHPVYVEEGAPANLRHSGRCSQSRLGR